MCSGSQARLGEWYDQQHRALAKAGYRVIALAYKVCCSTLVLSVVITLSVASIANSRLRSLSRHYYCQRTLCSTFYWSNTLFLRRYQKIQDKERKVLTVNRAEAEKDLAFAGLVAFNCLNRADSSAVLSELKCVAV